MMKHHVRVALILIVVVTVGVGIYFGAQTTGNHLLSSQAPTAQAATCQGQHQTHEVTIKNGVVTPRQTTGVLCDKLLITNQDNTLRLMAFGDHDHHQTYDGVEEKPLEQGQSLTVTMNQAGTFKFHDHIHDEVQGIFTVTK